MYITTADTAGKRRFLSENVCGINKSKVLRLRHRLLLIIIFTFILSFSIEVHVSLDKYTQEEAATLRLHTCCVTMLYWSKHDMSKLVYSSPPKFAIIWKGKICDNNNSDVYGKKKVITNNKRDKFDHTPWIICHVIVDQKRIILPLSNLSELVISNTWNKFWQDTAKICCNVEWQTNI